jgi:tRNA threonylcarbamoyladenosine biosynthesis protein TsaE
MSNEIETMIESFCAEDTYNAGVQLGSELVSGDVVYLNGDMGTGKTEFTKGIAKGLGVEDYVVSPTFTIVNEYTGRCPLYHFDVYRISDEEEMFDIGFEEYLYGNGVVVIEWSEIIKGILPQKAIYVDIIKDMDKSDDFRKIVIKKV